MNPDLVHANEFLVHMGLHHALPVWQWRFGVRLTSEHANLVQRMVFTRKEPVPVPEVEGIALEWLGDEGARWMNEVYISQARPRSGRQAALLSWVVAPSLSPDRDPVATARLADAVGPYEELIEAYEGLLVTLTEQAPQSQDQPLIDSCHGMIHGDDPTRRLTDSLYIEVMARAMPELAQC